MILPGDNHGAPADPAPRFLVLRQTDGPEVLVNPSAVAAVVGDANHLGASLLVLPGYGVLRVVGDPTDVATRVSVPAVRLMGITPHVAQHTTRRRSAIDARTTRHPGYALSQRCRKQVEQPFG